MQKNTIILIYSLIACVLLYLIENVYHPVYLAQMIQKIVLFAGIPLLVATLWKREVGRAGKMNLLSIKYGVSLGLLSMVIIGVTYSLLRDMIDWTAIRESMDARHIDETTFIFIFAYIMFGNSWIEEYFFRGVVFRSLSEISVMWGYIVSALAFSLYHITIFGTWFSGWILGLALLGLVLGGVFFAWLYRRTGGIWGAWIFHIFADLAILVIGYIEFFV